MLSCSASMMPRMYPTRGLGSGGTSGGGHGWRDVASSLPQNATGCGHWRCCVESGRGGLSAQENIPASREDVKPGFKWCETEGSRNVFETPVAVRFFSAHFYGSTTERSPFIELRAAQIKSERSSVESLLTILLRLEDSSNSSPSNLSACGSSFAFIAWMPALA